MENIDFEEYKINELLSWMHGEELPSKFLTTKKKKNRGAYQSTTGGSKTRRWCGWLRPAKKTAIDKKWQNMSEKMLPRMSTTKLAAADKGGRNPGRSKHRDHPPKRRADQPPC